jgi:hypothetical protein
MIFEQPKELSDLVCPLIDWTAEGEGFEVHVMTELERIMK